MFGVGEKKIKHFLNIIFTHKRWKKGHSLNGYRLKTLLKEILDVFKKDFYSGGTSFVELKNRYHNLKNVFVVIFRICSGKLQK